jgi:hypothetical protein
MAQKLLALAETLDLALHLLHLLLQRCTRSIALHHLLLEAADLLRELTQGCLGLVQLPLL